ncbi:hypothetical protein PR048_020673 [Dryococelus australis]|uniref:Peptidase M10 metallopeptidase domain-containing protein n=1 Tax=Dryococelus australis TaxID=614101 RepID=A0ABQ9H6Y4_9NEOP|nr:hypothetical protein PR048_020673 [Dryococelus australis]
MTSRVNRASPVQIQHDGREVCNSNVLLQEPRGKVNLRTRGPRNMESGYVRAELDQALKVWARHSKLTFQEVDSDRADILVFFERSAWAAVSNETLTADKGEMRCEWSSAGMKRHGKWEIPEKAADQPAIQSDSILVGGERSIHCATAYRTRLRARPRWHYSQSAHLPPRRTKFDYQLVAPRFLHVGIASHYAAGFLGDLPFPPGFSGISRFPRPCIRALLRTHPASPSSALKTSMGTEDPRENPPTNGIVRHESHMRKSRVIRPGIELGSPWWEASRLTAQPPWPHLLQAT